MKKITSIFKEFNRRASLSLLSVSLAAVDQIDIKPKEEFSNLVNYSVPGIIQTLLRLILVIAAVVSFIFLVIGGIKWITSGGEKEQTAKAQGTITAALIGLVIVFAAWAIIRLLETFFSISIFTLNIPTIPTDAYPAP